MRADESGVEMTIKTIQAPNWVAFDEETGVLSLSPDEDVVPGLYPATLLGTGQQGTLARYMFEILVGSSSLEQKDSDGKSGDQSVERFVMGFKESIVNEVVANLEDESPMVSGALRTRDFTEPASEAGKDSAMTPVYG